MASTSGRTARCLIASAPDSSIPGKEASKQRAAELDALTLALAAELGV